MDYDHLARDLTLWMKQDQNEDSWFTTMIDFYALPINFPGRVNMPPNLTAPERVLHLEEELRLDIIQRLNPLSVSRRFIPYIQLHEFEALLFSDPTAFLEAFPGNQKAVAELAAIRAKFPNPEDIDDDPRTAPSKRILKVFPDYQKPVAGILVAQRIGLTGLRDNCRHFDLWFARLLGLSDPSTAFTVP